MQSQYNDALISSLERVAKSKDPVVAKSLIEIMLDRDYGDNVCVEGVLTLLSQFADKYHDHFIYLKDYEDWMCVNFNIEQYPRYGKVLAEGGYLNAAAFLKNQGMNDLLNLLLLESSAACWSWASCEHFFKLKELFDFKPSDSHLQEQLIKNTRANGRYQDVMAVICWWACGNSALDFRGKVNLKYHSKLLIDVLMLHSHLPLKTDRLKELVCLYFGASTNNLTQNMIKTLLRDGAPREVLMTFSEYRRDLLVVEMDI